MNYIQFCVEGSTVDVGIMYWSLCPLQECTGRVPLMIYNGLIKSLASWCCNQGFFKFYPGSIFDKHTSHIFFLSWDGYYYQWSSLIKKLPHNYKMCLNYNGSITLELDTGSFLNDHVIKYGLLFVNKLSTLNFNAGVTIWQKCGVTGQSYTYADIQRKSFRLANSLRKCGFKRGDTVAIVLVNCPDYPVVILGALEAELAICFVNHSYTAGRYHKPEYKLYFL